MSVTGVKMHFHGCLFCFCFTKNPFAKAFLSEAQKNKNKMLYSRILYSFRAEWLNKFNRRLLKDRDREEGGSGW